MDQSQVTFEACYGVIHMFTGHTNWPVQTGSLVAWSSSIYASMFHQATWARESEARQ